jgi:hypothetical protein
MIAAVSASSSSRTAGRRVALTAPELLVQRGMRYVFKEYGKLSPSTIGHWFAAHKGKPYGAYVLCRTILPGKANRVLWHVDVLPPR